MAIGPALTTDQNILPVQAYFNLDGSFNTFLGQGQPFVVSATESIGIIDTTVSGTFYPTFSAVNTGQITTLSVTSTKLSFNPSTGVLTANGGFVGSLNGIASTATNLQLGGANTLIYQSSSGNTAYLTNGTTGQVLTATTGSAPSWTTPTFYASVTDDTTTNATRYPLFANQTSGSLSTEYTSSTKYQYNPSTGTLSATIFSGSGASLTSIPNSALTNSSITLGSTAISLGGTATTVAGLTSVTSTTFVGALTGNASTATSATTATNATNIAITDNTSSSSTYYPVLSVNSSGNNPATTSSTKLSFVPSTGTLAATVFSGSGASLTNIPNTGITGLGTMSTQNANAVAITGGTIDNTVIGGTTPAAGTFTTITGQTEVLKGTGQNFSTYSQAYTSGSWGLTNGVLTGSQTDPLGGSTAFLFAENTTNGSHILQLVTGVTPSNTVYSYSQYIKSAVKNQLVLAMSDNTTGQAYALFDTNAGTVSNLGTGIANIGAGSWTNISGTITSVGSGWYRCTLTATRNAGTQISIQMFQVTSNNVSYAGTTGAGVYVWGSQLELGTTANTYIPTTTTAVYGTPTLSFSGVAGLGLQSDGSLYVSPAGTGALQAQKTDSTATGGNARGANAVDWQTLRSSASQVASGLGAVISGGRTNSSTSQDSFVGAGYGNTASNIQSVVGGGAGNVASSQFSFIGGGASNTANGQSYNAIVGGFTNTVSGYFNFVGGGQLNSATSSAAVTTQSGTMNATTAVTLSGSNASIKVGQLITGTSINFPTYVAAISGTSLTLSQNASGSSTSTLSFYTPHGVVVGGGNNQATGSYSFIGGGGDAGTAANRNVASGDWSFVGGGLKNTASGLASFIGGGGLYSGTSSAQPNQATNSASVVVGGLNNTTSGFSAFIGSGQSNFANSQYSTISGGAYGTTRSIAGNHVFPAHSVPISFSTGVSQAALLILGVQTTDATATVLRSDTSAASGTNQVILPNNSAYLFKATVIATVTGGGDTSGWKLEGVIKRGSGVGTAAIVGLVSTTLLGQNAGAATWAVTATADTTNGGLAITVTGQASTTIRWVCKVDTTEVTY